MIARILFVACIAVLMLSSAACDRTADKQRQEEAINRGEVPAAQTQAMANTGFKGACERAGGDWQAATSRCAMTAAMCPSPGEWDDAIGCVLPSISADECKDMENQGIHLVGEVCAITDLSSEQFEQLGVDGEH